MDLVTTDLPSEYTDYTEPSSLKSVIDRPWTYIILIWITAVIAMIGNLLVILAFIFDRKLLKTNFNIYILNLAITDISVATMSMPFYAMDLYNGSVWQYDQATCAFWILMDWGMTFASIFFLVAISIDR